VVASWLDTVAVALVVVVVVVAVDVVVAVVVCAVECCRPQPLATVPATNL